MKKEQKQPNEYIAFEGEKLALTAVPTKMLGLGPTQRLVGTAVVTTKLRENLFYCYSVKIDLENVTYNALKIGGVALHFWNGVWLKMRLNFEMKVIKFMRLNLNHIDFYASSLQVKKLL